MKTNMQSQYNTYGGAKGYKTFQDYLKATIKVSDDAAYDEYCKNSVKKYMKEKMAISVIASQNKINISVADLTKFGNQYASYYGYTSYQQLIEKYGKQLNCEVGYNTLRAKTAEWFASNVKEEAATTQPSQSTEATTSAN